MVDCLSRTVLSGILNAGTILWGVAVVTRLQPHMFTEVPTSCYHVVAALVFAMLEPTFFWVSTLLTPEAVREANKRVVCLAKEPEGAGPALKHVRSWKNVADEMFSESPQKNTIRKIKFPAIISGYTVFATVLFFTPPIMCTTAIALHPQLSRVCGNGRELWMVSV